MNIKDSNNKEYVAQSIATLTGAIEMHFPNEFNNTTDCLRIICESVILDESETLINCMNIYREKTAESTEEVFMAFMKKTLKEMLTKAS